MAGFLSRWFARGIRLARPLTAGAGVKLTRRFQDLLGSSYSVIVSRRAEFAAVEGCVKRAVWVSPRKKAAEGHVLYLHGGGYFSGTLEYTKYFGYMLAAGCGKKVFCLDYALAPEHPFPAALDDAFDAYKYLLGEGISPQEITVAGESAGGGLMFCLMHKLKKENVPMPACLISISPWADLTLSSRSIETNKKSDVAIDIRQLQRGRQHYVPLGEDFKNPLISPIFADFDGFPPALIFVGGDEILLDDARAVHDCCTRAGVESQLVIEDGMWHVYPLYKTAESRAAFVKMDSFMRRHMK